MLTAQIFQTFADVELFVAILLLHSLDDALVPVPAGGRPYLDTELKRGLMRLHVHRRRGTPTDPAVQVIERRGTRADGAHYWKAYALNKLGKEITASPISVEMLAGMLKRIGDKTISGKIAKDVFERMWAGEGRPLEAIDGTPLLDIKPVLGPMR